MREIIVYTTSIAIHDYKKGKYGGILSSLTVWDTYPNGGKYAAYEAYYKDDENEILFIHRGYPLHELMKAYPYHTLKYDLTPDPYKKMKLIMKSKPRDEKQRKCIDYLLGVNEYEGISDINQKFVCMKPGDGKTYCAIEFTVRKGLIPIIIVNNDKILKQWKDSYLKFTNIAEEEIFTISGSNSIKKLMKITNHPYKVYLASHRTLASFTSNDLTLMNNIFSKIGIGIKIFDEAHMEWRNIFNIDMYTDIKYNIYLTATPSRSNYNENIVYKNMFNEVMVYGLEEKKDDPLYHRIVYYSWNSHPNTKNQVDMVNNHGFDCNAYNEYLLTERKDEFFSIIENLLKQFFEKDNESKIAIVVNCNNMIESLKNYLQTIFSDKSIGMFCGLIANKKDREKELDKDIILATLRGFNAGVDVKNLNVVINTVSFSSETLINQLSGRLRYIPDKKSWFIDITDTGFSQCCYHSKIRKRFLKTIAKKQFSIDNTTN